MSRVFEVLRRRRDLHRQRQRDGNFNVSNGDYSEWSHDLPRVKLALAMEMPIIDFGAWLDGDEVRPFFNEFERDCLGDAGDYIRPVTRFKAFLSALEDFKARAEVSKRGLSHGLKDEDKTCWGVETHWAWFAFQMWWVAVHNPTGSRWRRADPELRFCTAKFLMLLIECLQVDWITNSTAARYNREEADRREGTDRVYLNEMGQRCVYIAAEDLPVSRETGTGSRSGYVLGIEVQVGEPGPPVVRITTAGFLRRVLEE